MPTNAEWIESHLKYLSGLRSLNRDQQHFIELATIKERSASDEKKFKAALNLEKISQRMVKAKAEIARLNTAAKRAARKKRDHELYNSAGLMILAGLVDTQTGKPLIDKASLLGALMGLSKVTNDDKRWTEWKRIGDEKLAASDSKKTKKAGPSDT